MEYRKIKYLSNMQKHQHSRQVYLTFLKKKKKKLFRLQTSLFR